MEKEHGDGIMSIFPFTAIVAQDQMKQALVVNVINPAIGGVLIMGEKGDGKEDRGKISCGTLTGD